MKELILTLMVISFLPFINLASADHLPNSMLSEAECADKMGRDCFCWEQGNCSFTSDPLGTMLLPYDSVFGGLAMVIFWALIVGLLWLRTESPQLVGMIGIAMSASYMGYLETTTGAVTGSPEFETARIIGVTLLVVSMGIAFYQMIIGRILNGGQPT
jgi:hypothetical protein|tara:strand:- start:103 stop:576 length:474 start_codon:yes stop_codon:yes gene_type:complete